MRIDRMGILQAIGYLAAMATLAGVLGWQLLGTTGALVAVGLATAVLLLTRGSDSGPAQLRRLGARRFSAWQAPGLFDHIRKLATRAQLASMPALYALPSPQPNALTVGSADTAAIAVTTGLLNGLSTRELHGVLAHEIAHIRNNDVWLAGLAGGVRRLTGAVTAVGLLVLLLALPATLFGFGQVSPLLLLLLLIAPSLSGLLQLALSRSREFQADRTAVALAGDATGLASALAKLEYANQSLMAWLFGWPRAAAPNQLLLTHPPAVERVRRLRQLQPPSRAAARAMPAAARVVPVHAR